MPTFEQEIIIDASPSNLFWLTQDYGQRLDWDPCLKEARLVDGATEPGFGVRAWCVARNGLDMETEYVSFRPPYTAAVKLTRGPFNIAAFAGSWRFREIAPNRTRVIFRYHIEAAPRFWSFILGPILSRIFLHKVAKRLKELKQTIETTDILQLRPAESPAN